MAVKIRLKRMGAKKLGDYVKCSAKGCKYKHIPEGKGAHKDGE